MRESVSSSQAKWQLPRPRQVAVAKPRLVNVAAPGAQHNLWKVGGGNQLTRLIG